MYSIEVVHHADDAFIRELLKMRSEAFPEGWEYTDAKDYYQKMIEDPNNISIIIKDKDEILGYLLAIPHNKAIVELKKDDPLMKDDSECFYIETMEIHPELQKTGLFLKMLYKLFEEAEKHGIDKFSMHARVNNSLSSVVQRRFIATEVRRVENWPYYNAMEPTDYIIATYR